MHPRVARQCRMRNISACWAQQIPEIGMHARVNMESCRFKDNLSSVLVAAPRAEVQLSRCMLKVCGQLGTGCTCATMHVRQLVIHVSFLPAAGVAMLIEGLSFSRRTVACVKYR